MRKTSPNFFTRIFSAMDSTKTKKRFRIYDLNKVACIGQNTPPLKRIRYNDEDDENHKKFLDIFPHEHHYQECPFDKINDFSFKTVEKISLINLFGFKFPKDLSRFEKLTNLTLYDNWMYTLSPKIGELTQLCSLSLDCNNLTNLPNSLSNLSNLTELNLSSNCFENIPSVVFKLSKLTRLSLTNNEINLIPNQIVDLVELDYINLYHNPIKSLPYRMLSRRSFKNQLKLLKFGEFYSKHYSNEVNSLFCLAASAFFKKINHPSIVLIQFQLGTLKNSTLISQHIRESLIDIDHWFCDNCKYIQFGSIFIKLVRKFSCKQTIKNFHIDDDKFFQLIYNFCSTKCSMEFKL